MRKIIAVIGDAKIDKNGIEYKLAFETGKALIDAGYRIQTGGLGGVMQAVFDGAKSSKMYKEGDTIAIIPSFDRNEVNESADIVIPTGLDILRNVMVVNANAVIAIGGGAGTLSEMAMAWSVFKLIIAYTNVGGWSAKVANTKLDERVRYSEIADDRIFGVETPQEMISILNNNIDKYTRPHVGIKFRK